MIGSISHMHGLIVASLSCHVALMWNVPTFLQVERSFQIFMTIRHDLTFTFVGGRMVKDNKK